MLICVKINLVVSINYIRKMFKVQGNDYPNQLNRIYTGSGAFLIDSNNYNTATILKLDFDFIINPDPIPNACPVFIRLIDGTILTPVPTIDALVQNTFFCENGNITYYETPVNPVIYIHEPLPYTSTLPTTYLAPPFPTIYYEYVIDGVVTYNRTFKGHPSCEFTFTTFNIYKDIIFENFRIGKLFTIANINYQVSGFSLSELNERKYPQDLIAVSVSFTGKWDSNSDKNILDRPISLRHIYDEYPQDNNGNNTLAQLANCIGVNLYGIIPIIKIPPDVDSKSTTTLRQEIESRAVTVKSFPFYSDDNLKLKRWDSYSGTFIADRDIINDESIQIEYSGTSFPYQGIQLVKELWNARVELAQQNQEEIGEEDYQLTDYVNAENDYDLENPVHPRRSFSFYTQYDSYSKDILRLPTANFDNGGITKTKRVKTFRNGVEITTEEWTYGFNFTSNQVYDIDVETIAPNQYRYTFQYNIPFDIAPLLKPYWQLVKYVKTAKGFSDEENEYGVKEWYLTIETTEGFEYVRPTQESEALEVAQAKADYATDQITLTEYNKIIEKYTAQKVVLDSPNTEYTLEPLSNYYDDIPQKTPEDDNYVVPRFVRKKRTEEHIAQIKTDPTATEDEPKPDLIAGHSFVNIEETIILTPRNKTAKRRSPEIFQVTNYVISNSNNGNRSELTVTQNAGRPTIQETLNPNVRPFSQRPDPNNTNTNIVINTPNSDKDVYGIDLEECGDIEGETFSYPDIFDVDQVIDIAEVDLAMQNIDAITVSLTLGKSYNLKEGDVVLWRNKYWLVKDISESHEIERGRVRLSDYTIKLGCYFPKIPITKTNVPNNN